MNNNILRKKSVLKAIKVSSSTLWRMCKSGSFPKPIQIGPNSVGWIEDEVSDWITKRKSQRNRKQ